MTHLIQQTADWVSNSVTKHIEVLNIWITLLLTHAYTSKDLNRALDDKFYPRNNRKNLRRPEPMQQEVFDFIGFMHAKIARPALPSKHEPALLSEQALAVDWNRSEEDEAWASYQ